MPKNAWRYTYVLDSSVLCSLLHELHLGFCVQFLAVCPLRKQWKHSPFWPSLCSLSSILRFASNWQSFVSWRESQTPQRIVDCCCGGEFMICCAMVSVCACWKGCFGEPFPRDDVAFTLALFLPPLTLLLPLLLLLLLCSCFSLAPLLMSTTIQFWSSSRRSSKDMALPVCLIFFPSLIQNFVE